MSRLVRVSRCRRNVARGRSRKKHGLVRFNRSCGAGINAQMASSLVRRLPALFPITASLAADPIDEYVLIQAFRDRLHPLPPPLVQGRRALEFLD
jgi:hypothetical protein